MYAHAAVVLGVMVVAFALAYRFKLTVELSMVVAAVAGALTHGAGIPARHLVEGAFTYFDVTLIFLTATLFMNLLKESGGVTYIIRAILIHFHQKRWLLLLLLTLILMVPGALTGAGSVTVLVLGGLVGTVLMYMGVSPVRVAAIVFLCAAMSAAAPPVNLWAMMAAAGSNMPYVGFTVPLLVISLAGALFSMYYLGWKSQPVALSQVLQEIPEPPPDVNGWKVAAPFVLILALILAGRIWPFDLPVLGLPLVFMLAAVLTVLLMPRVLVHRIWDVSRATVEALLPLVGTLTAVGILVQIMALSGARGLLSLSVVTMPLAVVIGTAFILLPISEGVLQYGAAPLLGVPLVLLFNMKGLDPIIALAGMATLWPLGDAFPPTALVGRATVMTTGYGGPYYRGFLKACVVPMLVIAALGTGYIAFSRELSFLVGG